MKLAVIAWEEWPDKITYTAGFFDHETATEVLLATEYDPIDGYKDITRIPIRAVRERRYVTVKKITAKCI